MTLCDCSYHHATLRLTSCLLVLLLLGARNRLAYGKTLQNAASAVHSEGYLFCRGKKCVRLQLKEEVGGQGGDDMS